MYQASFTKQMRTELLSLCNNSEEFSFLKSILLIFGVLQDTVEYFKYFASTLVFCHV
jgi:hypothetical protein